MDPIATDENGSSPRWVARLYEVLQPLSARAGRLAAIELFAGFPRPELEAFAGLFEDVEVRRGTRLTVQGQPDARLWLISDGEALVSADARPLRVIRHGDAAGVTGMLHSVASPETTIALTPLRSLTAGPAEFETLLGNVRVRRRLTALAGERPRPRRTARSG